MKDCDIQHDAHSVKIPPTRDDEDDGHPQGGLIKRTTIAIPLSEEKGGKHLRLDSNISGGLDRTLGAPPPANLENAPPSHTIAMCCGRCPLVGGNTRRAPKGWSKGADREPRGMELHGVDLSALTCIGCWAEESNRR